MPRVEPSVELDRIASAVVDAAYRVHTTLGPGLLESVYELCFEHEMKSRGFAARRQVAVPVRYGAMTLDAGLRIDLLVEEAVVVEIKSVERMLPVFDAQLLTYLKLSGKQLGFLINFNVPLIRDGIRRRVLTT